MESQLVLYVNVDVAFLLNFLTDLAWLWATRSLAGLRTGFWRLALAAAAGAAASVWAFFPTGRWLATAPGVIGGTAVLLILAFCPCRLQQAVRAAAYFLFSGAVMAGAVLLLSARQGGPVGLPGSAPPDVPAALVAPGLLICLAGARYLWASARGRHRLARELYDLRVRIGPRELELPALLDTGNALRDPLTGTPVAVVELEALRDLLPPLVREAAGEGWSGLTRLPASWQARCRPLPFRAVGQPEGILLALVPDGLTVRRRGRRTGTWRAVRGLVALTREPLHPEGTYRALLPPPLTGMAEAEPGMAWEGETG